MLMSLKWSRPVLVLSQITKSSTARNSEAQRVKQHRINHKLGFSHPAQSRMCIKAESLLAVEGEETLP